MYGKCTYVYISTAKNKEKQSELCSLQAVILKKYDYVQSVIPPVTCMTHAQTRESSYPMAYMALLTHYT